MWLDARAKLMEIAGQPPAASVSLAPAASPVSRLSRVSQPPAPPSIAPRVAEVAVVATPPARTPEPKPSAESFPHGLSVTGQPLTWTGRIVSLDAWRILTEWEKHGPNGRHWNGITKQWEDP
jgi:hypothetical protein